MKRNKGVRRNKVAAVFLALLVLLSVLPMAASAASPLEGYPGIDELPADNTIPNPFAFFFEDNDPSGDGYVSTTAEWEARREEIKDLVQRYWLGYRWPTAAQDVVGGPVTQVRNEQTLGGWSGRMVSFKDEFDILVETLKTQTVEVYEVVSAGGWFGFNELGDLKGTFGPAQDPEDQEALIALALETWNAGYHLMFSGWLGTTYEALVNFTGILTEPPALFVPGYVEYAVTVQNPGRLAGDGQPVKEYFPFTLNMPTAEQIEAAWGSPDAKVPFVVDIGGTSAMSAANLNAQGYARISFTPTDIYPDTTTAPINRSGLYTRLYPYDANTYEYASGALMAWGWAVSQIISAMEQPMAGSSVTYGDYLGLDPAKTVVTGHSRYGKAAMFAAAFDERISICVPSEPGGSGIQSNRYKVEGKIFNFNTYPKADRIYGKTEIPTVSYGSNGNSWFPETAAMFYTKDNQIPFDSSDIIALVAPRPFIAFTGIDSHWLGNEGGVAAVLAASEVYDYIGGSEIEQANIAVRARESDHVFYNRDFCFVLAIMDREFKQNENDRALHVQDLFPTGTGLNGMSYPAKDYATIGEMNSYPFEINSSFMPWSSANKYTLWTAQENFLVGFAVTITAHSNAPDVDLYLPDGETKIDAASAANGTFTFELSPQQAVYGRYELRTNGQDKNNRSVFFAAVSLADALRHGTTKGDEGEENRVMGFSSRLANTADDLPQVYVSGDAQPLTMSLTPARFKTEETTLMEYGIQFHDPLFSRLGDAGWKKDNDHTFNVKNLKFVTIPGYTFEISYSDIYASSANIGKDGADQFAKAISWNVEQYNNGPAKIWPEWPHTLEERASGVVNRPISPEQKPTNFNTEITGVKAEKTENTSVITIEFNEPLRTGEFGFGLNIADAWTTTWNEEGTAVSLTVANADVTATQGSLIIYRLMDMEGNLIGGPLEMAFEIVDKAALQALVDEVGALNADAYTTASWNAAETVLAEAEAVLADEAATQADIDLAYSALLAARDALVEKKPAGSPDASVKEEEKYTRAVEGGYTMISFKLHDEDKIAGYQLNNGAYMALTPNKYSDVNYIKVGGSLKGAVYGLNTLKVFDALGNVSYYEFVLVQA